MTPSRAIWLGRWPQALLMLAAVALLALLVGPAQGTSTAASADQKPSKPKITQAEREAAAARAKKKGLVVPEPSTGAGMDAAAAMDPAATPHYFGPYPNYANSPLRLPDAVVDIVGDGTGAAAAADVDIATGAVTGLTLLDGGTGYTTPPTVSISSIGSGTVAGTGAGATATATITGAVSTIALDSGGSGYTAPVTVTFGGGGGTGADATATVTPVRFVSGITVTSGGTGYTTATVAIAGDGTGATADAIVDAVTGAVTGITVTNGGSGYSTATVTITGDGAGATADAVLDTTSGPITAVTLVSGGSGYSSPPTISFSDASGAGTGAAATSFIVGSVSALTLVDPGTGYVTKGIRKFVNTLPGLGEGNANDLGQYMPVAMSDTLAYPGSDYYEIAVVEYTEKMHADLPATRLRGYVQLSTAAVPGKQIPLTYPDGTPIMSPMGTPVLAVDKPHYLGPFIVAKRDRPVRVLFRNYLPTGAAGNLFIPVDQTVMGAGMGPAGGTFTQNRATLHLHGGRTPWISDGTPHQWITPAGENTPYPKGVSVYNVPDMPDPGPGAQTFFYTNQQGARLQFYHDHAWGITRLNVYAGEAAGYVVTDPVEQDLVDRNVLPAEQLPLVIQDKTFVPDTFQLAMEDPTWDGTKWGGLGNLWEPHVYVPAQNPDDPSGMNAFGRWHYGPWFWPPTTGIQHGPVANPYYDPVNAPWEPQYMPGTPTPSMGMEAFNDTPTVNGTVYPTVTIQPKAYRLRILNAANDRFWNLQLYVADPTVVTGDGRTNTEVKMVPATNTPGFPALWPTDNREGGVPDPATAGPNWIVVGSEGGFLPSPVVVENQPITWNFDPTTFNFGNVQDHSLLLAPAERSDAVVDFSQYAGKTLILYNDAPAAFPALDPRYDYYTGAPDLTDTGGVPSPIAGFGPNTRTIMQIKVADAAPAAPYDLAALQAAFAPSTAPATPLASDSVFARDQDPIVVGQAEYNSAYGSNFPANVPYNGISRIFDKSLPFKTLWGQTLTLPMQPKAIQDEMGEAFDREYGRMSGNFGIQQTLQFVLFPFVNPPTEKLWFNADPLGPPGGDGTQLWKITHNGVDTHPIHVHAFDAQLVNRVGWDNAVRRPHPTELGWKETFRVSPLEDTIIAMRPIKPKLPFGVPDSVRPFDPSIPIGSLGTFNSVDPVTGEPITPPITNQLWNYGWEYVVHCHILSHEEMDMMRPMVLVADRKLAEKPVIEYARGVGGTELTWTDGTPVTASVATWGDPANEVGFRIERADVDKNGKVGVYAEIGKALANATTFFDASADATLEYSYRVIAWNAAGDSVSMPVLAGLAGVPAPAAPTSVVATLQLGPQITVSWFDNAVDETGFVVERSTGAGPFIPIATPPALKGTGAVSFVDLTVKASTTYTYRVEAVNGGGSSGYANTTSITLPDVPAAPSNLAVTATIRNNNSDQVTLTWSDNSTTEVGFTIERSTTADFASVTSYAVGANVTTFTQTTARNRLYFYRVQAYNLGGASGPSNVASLTTP